LYFGAGIEGVVLVRGFLVYVRVRAASAARFGPRDEEIELKGIGTWEKLETP
jgi:hypothetical protein